MLKKNEVLEILENGGHIGMDTIRCCARVYDVDGIGVGTCRYDTADRIGHTDGYSISQSSGWNFYKRVWKDVIEATEQETTKGEPEQAQEAAQNEEENEMNKTNLTNREIRAARETLVNAHSANRENGPAATVAALVDVLGYDRACEIVALMTAARGTWDDRISSDSRAWAASVTSTTESELTDRCIYYCDEIHPAHFEQIAQAMQQYQPAQEEPAQDEQQPAETEQEKTDRENRKHCKRIADELEAYVGGSVYRCPECGETFREDDAPSDDDDMCTCPCCNERVSIHDLEQCSLYDYLADALDVDYTINGSDRDTVKSVRVMVAFGGPTIYIDSATRAVELYWWTDRASYPISSDAADALDEWAQELWTCC